MDASVTHVGCGRARCGTLQNVGYSDGDFVVCNYGNWSVTHTHTHQSPEDVLLKIITDNK